MSCLKASELMSLRLDAPLSEEEDRALQNHLANCEACSEEWEKMQVACALFEDVEFASPSAVFQERILSKIGRRNTWTSIQRGGGIFFLSLIVLIALGFGPLMNLVTMASENPSFVRALAGLVAGGIAILGTLLDAVELILRAMLAGPYWLILVGAVAVAMTLAFGGVRLVTVSRHNVWRRTL